MRAVVLDGHGSVTLTTMDPPEPGDAEVVIAPEAVGVCGTDLHLADGDYPTGRFPVVPGHEFAGTVTAIGRDVTTVAVGERVCVDPNVACGACADCLTGAPNLCEFLLAIGVTVDGACADLVKVPASVVYPLPAGVSMASGALVEPLACVLHAFDRGPGLAGRRVLIYGAGSIGLLSLIMAHSGDAQSVAVIEPSAIRREAAAQLGATAVYAPGESPRQHNVDIAIEASGHPSAVSDAIARLAKRGTLLQMGVVNAATAIDLFPYQIFERELTIVGSQSLATAFPAAVDRISELPDIAERIVTHRFDLTEYSAALDAARSESARKVQVLPRGRVD
jgi:2-desacetyl-2-hydroxyethyl bacteriochlorophyllide A dehydrogenase